MVKSFRLKRFRLLRVPDRVVGAVLDPGFLKHFAQRQDPRVERTREHPLIDIVAIAILAVLSGADGWTGIETYGKAKHEWFAQFLELPNGIPSDDTFARVFARLDPERFGQCFARWMSAVVERLGAQVIAIAGKSVRGSDDREGHRGALHLVSAWATQHRIVLAQAKVENKANEITAIPKVLALLDLVGCIVTIDAMGCQKEIAAQIIAQQGDYILALKGNQGNLHQAVQNFFQTAQTTDFADIEHDFYPTVEGGHHRVESRHAWVVPLAALGAGCQFQPWQGLQTVVRLVSQRRLWNKNTREIRFYITSLPAKAQTMVQSIRSHWGIENQLHWVLDVTFNEDASRLRKDQAPENFARLRRMATDLLAQEQTCQGSLKMKRYQAALDNNYLLTILATMNSQVLDSEASSKKLSNKSQN